MLFFLSVTWCSYRWCLQTTLHMVVCFHLFLEFLKQNKRASLYISYSQRNIMLHVMFLECFSSDRNFLAHSVRCLCSPGSEIVTGLRAGKVTAGLVESNGSLPPGLWLTSPARCQEPGSAPGPYARQWSIGYLDLSTLYKNTDTV